MKFTRQQKFEYQKLRKKFLADHPICQVCKVAPSAVVHHTKGRDEHYLDVVTFEACCKPCEKDQHKIIQNNS